MRKLQKHQLKRDLKRRREPTTLSSRLALRAGDWIERKLRDIMFDVVERHHRHEDRAVGRPHPMAWTVERLRGAVWRGYGNRARTNAGVRHRLSQGDVLMTALVGVIRDDVVWNGFDSINHLDLREWLTRHGLHDSSLEGPDVRVVYDESFAGIAGPSVLPATSTADKPAPAFAAGAALYGMVRTALPYRGSVMWQATA